MHQPFLRSRASSQTAILPNLGYKNVPDSPEIIPTTELKVCNLLLSSLTFAYLQQRALSTIKALNKLRDSPTKSSLTRSKLQTNEIKAEKRFEEKEADRIKTIYSKMSYLPDLDFFNLDEFKYPENIEEVKTYILHMDSQIANNINKIHTLFDGKISKKAEVKDLINTQHS